MRTISPALLRRLLVALLATAPVALGAQVPDTAAAHRDSVLVADTATEAITGRLFEVSALTGYQFFDKAAALHNSPTFGLRIVNPHIVGAIPGLSFGVSASFARPNTRGDYFPWNRQIYFSDQQRRNDTTLVFEVSQRLTMAHFGGELGYRIGASDAGNRRFGDWRGLVVDLTGGVGGYAFWEDPEQNHHNQVHSKLSYLLGGGIGVPLPARSMLHFRVDDLIFTGYNRNWFSLADPLFSEELFQSTPTNNPAPKSTVHNLRMSVQFSFDSPEFALGKEASGQK